MPKPKMETSEERFDLGSGLTLYVLRYEEAGERKYRLTVSHETQEDDEILDISHNQVRAGEDLHKRVKEFLTATQKSEEQNTVEEDLVRRVIKFIRVGRAQLRRVLGNTAANKDADALAEQAGIQIVGYTSSKPVFAAYAGDLMVGCIWGNDEKEAEISIAVRTGYRSMHIAHELVQHYLDEFGQTQTMRADLCGGNRKNDLETYLPSIGFKHLEGDLWEREPSD